MQIDIHERRLVLWWLLLVVLTVGSLEGAPSLSNKSLFSSVIIVIAFIKVRIVIREFMEIRSAPLPLRLCLEVWGGAVCGALLVMIV
jgi:hypothetical protein